MKAISLWQPWATAIAVGAKRIETRGWGTHYRGPIAIHAAKRLVKRELRDLWEDMHWRAALAPVNADPDKPWEALRFGQIVAVADLVDCRFTDTFELLDVHRRRDHGPYAGCVWTERQMGNFDPDRYGWVLKNVRPLIEPLPYKGKQGFFDVPDSLLLDRLGAPL